MKKCKAKKAVKKVARGTVVTTKKLAKYINNLDASMEMALIRYHERLKVKYQWPSMPVEDALLSLLMCENLSYLSSKPTKLEVSEAVDSFIQLHKLQFELDDFNSEYLN